jgi:hypothetical protein
LPAIPGQFPGTIIYAAPEGSSILSSTFTTVLKFTSGLGLLSNVVRYAQNLFRRSQNIRAEPVHRADGSRKKILIDAGLDDAPSTPTPNQRGIVSRRNKEYKQQGRAIYNSPATPTSNSPATPYALGYHPPSPPASSPISEAFIVHNADILDPLADDLIFPTHLPTFDEDFSELPDASPLSKKTVRFSNYQKTKYYYKDGQIDDVMDSFLEDIQTTQMTPKAAMDLQLEHMSLHGPHAPTRAQPLIFSYPLPQGTPETEGYCGVPQSTWVDSSDNEDSSLEQSMFSSELLDEFLQKVVIVPPKVVQAPIITPLITPLTTEERENLENIAAKSATQNSIIAPNLSIHDFKTLLPTLFNGNRSAWLNDEIVNEYLSILTTYQKEAEGYTHRKGGSAPPVHAFASQFWTNLKKSTASVSRWANRKQLGGKQLLTSRLILIPLCEKSHWRLVAIKPELREIHYLDSLSYDRTPIITKIREWLESELGDLYVSAEWTVIEQQLSSQQLNGSDCGVFTCLNSLVLLRGEEPKRVVACEGMDVARCRIAVTLIKGQPTTEF